MSNLSAGRRRALNTCALLAGFAVVFSSASAAVTANIVTNRTSGVAPLAVNFDASGTTSGATSRPFHDVYYSWDFGDTGSGTWNTSGKSKNHDTGPIAAHVFETPGNYTVTLFVKDASGATDIETVAISVSNPNTVFSGTNTICFSTNGDFSGAPSGAQLTTTTSWNTITAALGTGKRVLLRRGQVWNHSGSTKTMTFNGPGILGAFGSGARPILRYTSGSSAPVFQLGTGSTPGQFTDFRFMDLEVDGDGFDRNLVLAEGSTTNITILRIYKHEGGTFLTFGPDVLNYYNGGGTGGTTGHALHPGLAIVETQFDHVVGNGQEFNGNHIAYIGAQRFSFLGNVWNDSVLGEHVLRLPLVSRLVVSHNELTNSRAVKHLLKLHASDYPNLTPGQSGLAVIADNHFTSQNGDWYISVGPQNTLSSEVVRDVILERNEVIFQSDGDVAFHIAASEVTVRNNAVVLTAAGGGTAIDFTRRGVEPAPSNNRAYNNSAFNGGSGTFNFVSITSSASNTTVRNNLGKGNGTSNMISGSGSGLVQSNNSMTATPGWVSSSPTNALGFELTSGSSAINAGFATPVFDDYEEAPRPSGSAIDIGAFEFLGGGGGGPTVTITASDASAAEPSNHGQFTVTASPAPSSPLVVNLNRTGTATNGSDYATIAATVTVPTSGSVTIPVTVTNDQLVESSETAIVSIATGSGYTVGSPSSATVTITSDDTGVVANAGAGFQNTAITSQTGTFTATFYATPSVSLIDSVVGLAASAPSAYTHLAAIVRFNSSGNIDARNGGAYAAATTIPYSGGQTYFFRLAVNVPAKTYSIFVTPSGGSELTVGSNYAFRTEQSGVSSLAWWTAQVLSPGSSNVNVSNFTISGGGGTPSVTITANDASAGEPSNNGQFTVTASPAPSSPITVNLTRTGTATNGTDYTSIPTTVNVGTSGSATINVTVTNDSTVESSETVILTLASGAGYTIGSPNSATVTITDDDTVTNLLTHGTFEPNQATVLQDMPTTYTLGSGAMNIWFGRVGSASSQNTTYQTSSPSDHYVTVGGSANTNGCNQVITWPGAGNRQVYFSYRGTGSYVRIYGANNGNTINKFDGSNTMTLLATINNPSSSSWATGSQTVNLTGSYAYLVIQLRAGDFDNVTVVP